MKTLLTAFALTAAFATPALAQTVTNPAPITILDGAETTSTINVTGLSGNITSLSLTLNGLSHTYPDDLVFGLLNETANLGFVFFSGVGGGTDVVNATLTFSDDATDFAPESFVDGPLVSGTYLPSNFLGYEFTNFDNATSFSDFAGLAANGTWTLYVLDTFPADAGVIAGGFSLNFVTDATGAVPEPATWAMMIGGIGAAGGALRRRRTSVKVSYAA